MIKIYALTILELFKFGNWNGIICSRESKCHITKEKEEIKMAVLAKTTNKITVIKEKESSNFVREFNDNKVTKEFMDSCKKAGRLFGQKK